MVYNFLRFLIIVLSLNLALGCANTEVDMGLNDKPLQDPSVMQISVGASKFDITPDFLAHKVILASSSKPKTATGLLDPLYVRAIVIKSGNTKVGIVSIDQLYMTDDLYDAINARVKDMNLAGLVVQTTCIQSAEGHFDKNIVAQKMKTGSYQSASFEKRAIAAESALRIADQTAQDAIFVYESAHAVLEFENKSITYNQTETGDIERCMFFAKEDHNLIAQLINFSVMPQILSEDFAQISGDFAGRLSKLAESDFPHSIAISCPGVISEMNFNPNFINVFTEKNADEEILETYSKRVYSGFIRRKVLNNIIDFEKSWQYHSTENTSPIIEEKGSLTYKNVSEKRNDQKLQVFILGKIVFVASPTSFTKSDLVELRAIADTYNFKFLWALSRCNSHSDSGFTKKSFVEVQKTLASTLIQD